MSRHEGVSCDSCLKGSFRGKRYKCLICYDYDLCANCYESGATTTRHTAEHPMQCILTHADFDLYYGGEALNPEQPQAFTCPYCGKMGYTEATLLEHVTADHAGSSTEVVCPICASLAGGDPNHVTDDFAAHLALEHRTPREFEEPVGGGIRHVRRIPHPSRGVGGTRTRRSNMHFPSVGSSALSGLNPSGRETMDPIAELLSQLSSVRNRAAAAQNVSTQLQQLEMQLQSTSNPYSRQQLERLPRQPTDVASKSQSVAAAPTPVPGTTLDFPSPSSASSQFLLSRICEPELTELERQSLEVERADRSLFVQELFLSTLSQGLRLDDSDSDVTDSDDSDSESLGAFGNNPSNRNSGNSSASRQRQGNKVKSNNRKKTKYLDGSSSRNNTEKEPPPSSQAH